MKYLLLLGVVVGLASCISDVESARIVMSEPDETAVVRVLARAHRLSINEDRMFVHNNEKIMEVPEGQELVFEIVDRGDPTYRLQSKGAAGP